jgi:hypothetical protein
MTGFLQVRRHRNCSTTGIDLLGHDQPLFHTRPYTGNRSQGPHFTAYVCAQLGTHQLIDENPGETRIPDGTWDLPCHSRDPRT